MVRTAGFIFGVCLVVAVFVLVLRPGEGPQPGVSTGRETAPAPAESLEAVAAVAEPPGPAPGPAENRLHGEQPPEPAPIVAMGDTGATTASGAETSTPTQAGGAESGPTKSDSSAETLAAPASSYLFWSPFRSAWAAAGFAGRLSAATDVPVEVVEAEPGSFRVGFRYRDEAERRARVDLIEAITGLELE